ncbi:MAG: lytic transglycosylase domain-containing protein [Rhodospirillaceae bacterium]
MVVGILLSALLSGLLTAEARPVSAGSLSANDLDLYRAAFRHAESENWGDSLRIGAEPRERLPAKVIRWLDLARPASGNSFAAITDFIRANPKWPNQTGLLRQAEATIPQELPAAEVKNWFALHSPVSADGLGRYFDALTSLGDNTKAADIARSFWISANFANTDDELEFRRHLASQLRPKDHLARLDRLLWDHQASAVRRILSLFDDGRQALALARLALADDEPGLETAVRRVPDELATDPGLLYERVRWRRKKDNDAGALEILLSPPAELGRPALWWTERNIMIRRVLEKRNFALAYKLAKAHGQQESTSLVEAEFLTGWIALRHLHQPSDAFDHFNRMYRAAASPMSKSRGAFWCGRAAMALGDSKKATEWYEAAAKFPTMFYGQMAATVLNADQLALPPEPTVNESEVNEFNRRELVRVVHVLQEINPHDKNDRVGLFLRRLGRDASTAAEFVLLVRLAEETHRPEVAIAIAKQAFQAGVTLVRSGYPTLQLQKGTRTEPALTLALIRQESTFNTNIISSAGARGLMQLMPATAKLMATKLGLRYSEARLIDDPDYNIMMGTSFIGEMIDSYNGSYILAIAAYNAGGGRVHDWLNKYGDPRITSSRALDAVDWIESIPIAETRNYVQRILESLQVYRARLGTRDGEKTLKHDMRR